MFHSIISGVSRASRNSSTHFLEPLDQCYDALGGAPPQLCSVGPDRFQDLGGMSLLHEVNTPVKKATFALGCFWGPDSYFGATKGVIRTRVGFTGGSLDLPSYKNLGDHTEAIQLEFDPSEISYRQLLDIFWEIHDPTAKTTKQYTSIIFYHDNTQKELAEKSLEEQRPRYKQPIITSVVPAKEFYNAEDYHQKYRLQQHSFVMENIKLKPTTEDLTRSHVAARLNGYVVGCGGVKQFDEECKKLGLSDSLIEYVRKLVIKYEGQGLFC